MASKTATILARRLEPVSAAVAAVAVVLLLLINSAGLHAEQTTMFQYIQFIHFDSDGPGTASHLPNATGIILLRSHNYDICCYSEPKGSRNRMQFDPALLWERISNIQLDRSVVSCIQYDGSKKSSTLPREKLGGTAICEGFSADGNSSISEWFYFNISVPAKLNCNFVEVLSEKLRLDQRLEFQCQLENGWPASVLQCHVEGKDTDIVLKTASNASQAFENSTISVELTSWHRYYGNHLVCETRQLCPTGSTCEGDLLNEGLSARTRLLFEVKSNSECRFEEQRNLGRTVVTCNSSLGWPAVRHRCDRLSVGKQRIPLDEISLIANSPDFNRSLSLYNVSTFVDSIVASAETMASNSSIECIVQQAGFPDVKFSYAFVYDEKVSVTSASLDLAPIIVSLILLLVIVIVIIFMIIVAIRRRRSQTPTGALAAAGKNAVDNGSSRTG